jgi:site-specific DNA-methyltransferase (adenine-specific)
LKPYYQDSAVTIYHGDCREIGMKTVNEYKADLLLTDPPYGLKWSKLGFKRQPLLDSQEVKSWDEKPSGETLRLWIAGAEQWIIWGGNHFAETLGNCKGPLVWNKKTGNSFYADGEMAWANVSATLRIFTHQWCGAFKDSERNENAQHPTQKPLELMRWCIGLADNPVLIVDPFMGSGTTLRAAKDLGRKAIGIEIEERYCEIAAKRMAQEVLAL